MNVKLHANVNVNMKLHAMTTEQTVVCVIYITGSAFDLYSNHSLIHGDSNGQPFSCRRPKLCVCEFALAESGLFIHG